MNLTLFASLAFAHLVAVISPGPDFFYIVKSSFEKGLRSSIVSSIGIGLGVFFQCIFAMIGLDFLYDRIPSLYLVIGTVGSCYLVYLGLMGFSANDSKSIAYESNAEQFSFQKSFMGGLMVNLLNIKAFIFFAALFGGIILDTSVTFQLSISLYFFLATALWFCILSYSLHYGSKAFLNAAVQKIITRMSSLFLVLIGLSLGIYVWI